MEFADFTFRISGVSRALTHQLVRHRMASYAQRSQRYCVEDGFEFVTPTSISGKPEANTLYQSTIQSIQAAYDQLIALGVPAEDARMLLPNACASVICVKMNLRELIHFCNERLCACAQWEIRAMTRAMVKEVLAIEPEFEHILVPKCEAHYPYCFCTETKRRSCGRHPVISDVIKEKEYVRPSTDAFEEALPLALRMMKGRLRDEYLRIHITERPVYDYFLRCKIIEYLRDYYESRRE